MKFTKIINFILLLLLLICNSLSQSGWFMLNTGTGVTLNVVDFVNSNTGWFVTLNYYYTHEIMKTTNGGLNWFAQSMGSSSGQEINAVDFIDENTGWIVGTSGIILKTTNGGVSSYYQNAGGSTFNTVSFINSQTGWVGGIGSPYGVIYKTTDGGNNWINQANFPNSNVIDIFFVDENHGWVICLYSPNSLRTTDGGTTWLVQDLNYGKDIFFSDLNTGWGIGYSGHIYKSTNGGINWINQPSGTGHDLLSVKFINSNTGWVVGNGGTILTTTNGGSNWVSQNSPTTQDLRSLSFVNFETGYAGGGFGIVIKTTDGGGLYTNIISRHEKIPIAFSLSQNYPNPFNPTTKIKFELPLSRGVPEGRGVLTTLKIYDILCREATTLVNEELKPGSYEYEWDASNFSSGVYFYKLETKDFSQTKKLVLIK